MKSIIVGVVGYFFIRWNVGVIEASPPALYNLLMIFGTGIAVVLYILNSLFNSLTEPHYIHPTGQNKRAQMERNLSRAHALQLHRPAPRKRVIGVLTLKCAGKH
jgi:hypothetical protein